MELPITDSSLNHSISCPIFQHTGVCGRTNPTGEGGRWCAFCLSIDRTKVLHKEGAGSVALQIAWAMVLVSDRVSEGGRGTALFLPLIGPYGAAAGVAALRTVRLPGAGGMDDRYAGIERDLVHVKNALQTLSKNRGEFPLGAPICDPAYWRVRLQSIRVMADRYNYRDLRDRSDELLIEISHLQYWSPQRCVKTVGLAPGIDRSPIRRRRK